MTAREALEQLLDEFAEERLDDVLEYARYLSWKDEKAAWRQFGLHQLARAYGSDEPEYAEEDAIAAF
jgi:hypothetical protein